MKRIARKFTFPLMALLALLALTASVAEAADKADKIAYRLKWLRNVSVVGALYAEGRGLFEQQGLAVEVKAGGPERDAIRELELGYADFGEASADQVLRARAKGAPVVVIAQLFQINPLQWMYRPEDVTIKGLADLRGKSIGVTFGGNDETVMRTLLNEAGLGDGDVRLHSVRYDYTPFYRRQVQLWPVYRNAQGPILAAQLEREGEKVAFFSPEEFGVRFVANCVITSERTLRERPQLAERFLSALLAGWRQALDLQNEEEALAILEKNDPDTPRPILQQQLHITRGLIAPAATQAIGTIDVAGWEQTERIMREQKQLPQAVDVAAILRPLPPPGN